MTGEEEQQNKKIKTIFGKYEVGRLIGQGNFGRVYHGKNIETGESVAIKMMYKEQIEKEGMMDQIKREISVMRLVRHPNIVQLKEVMATKTKIYLIMEYLKGGDLFGRVDVERRGGGGKIKEDEARRYFQQLISAVDYCHSRGVSHRDLKLENLLLDENGDNLKVADFGLSALSGGVHDNNNNNNKQMMQPPQQQSKYNGRLLYTLCGAPAYVAPEVLRGKGYDGVKADVWSCGVILYSLLAGHLPFQDENLMKMYGKIFAGQFDFPPGFPSEARRLISKILVVNPDKRITIAMIKRVPWFFKGFKQPTAFSLEDTTIEGNHNHLDDMFNSQPHDHLHRDLNHQYSTTANGGVANSPAFFNAFEFISSMSSGFDLSNLFENKKRVGSMFTSKCSASTIMSKIEEAMGKKLKCNVSKANDFKMKILRTSEGQKGRLLVTAEVFEVAPEVAVVEFSKSAGDTLEYVRFCEEQIRPSLKDIVWTWQGDHNNNNNNLVNSSINVVK